MLNLHRKFEKLASSILEQCFDSSDEDTEKIAFANITTPFQLQHPKSIVNVAYNSNCFDFVSHTALRSMVQHRWHASLSPISQSRVGGIFELTGLTTNRQICLEYLDNHHNAIPSSDMALESVCNIRR